jgi:hypothetical protein
MYMYTSIIELTMMRDSRLSANSAKRSTPGTLLQHVCPLSSMLEARRVLSSQRAESGIDGGMSDDEARPLGLCSTGTFVSASSAHAPPSRHPSVPRSIDGTLQR